MTPAMLRLYSRSSQMCLKTMRFSCPAPPHCGLSVCPCCGQISSNACHFYQVAPPGVPGGSPGPDGGVVAGGFQGGGDWDIVVRRDRLCRCALDKGYKEGTKNFWWLHLQIVHWRSCSELNLRIVLGKAQDDFCDVSGSLGLQFLAHIQHRPAIFVFGNIQNRFPTEKLSGRDRVHYVFCSVRWMRRHCHQSSNQRVSNSAFNQLKTYIPPNLKIIRGLTKGAPINFPLDFCSPVVLVFQGGVDSTAQQGLYDLNLWANHKFEYTKKVFLEYTILFPTKRTQLNCLYVEVF